jgi:hypothetical protein
MGQLFKTISFPKQKSETNKTEMIRLAFNESTDLELYTALKDLRSSDIRALLPGITYRQLIQTATDERRSLNQLCLFLLTKKIEDIKKSYGNNISLTNVLSKNLVYTNIGKNSATFRDNKINEIHRWYPYIEGFSSTFIEEIIDNLSYKPTFIYDPFSGTGTTQLVASHKNIPSCYSEINPFMSFIIECKVNKVVDVINNNSKRKFEKVNDFINNLQKKFNKLDSAKINYKEYIKRLGTSNYFEKETLENLLKIKFIINDYFEEEAVLKDLCLFALSTIIVTVSNTIRRADLRYKRKDEKQYSPDDVLVLFIDKVREIISDISSIDKLSLCRTSFVSNDAKNIPQTYDKKFDLVITSPPYVNGTNYFRNTKLELVLLDFVNNIEDIALLKREAITSGINNVVLKGNNNIKIPKLQPIIDKLEDCAYDKRIPVLIESYFSDMFRVFSNISMHLDNEKYFYLDIGDSQFAGVHIPTDQIMIEIAAKNNFELIDNKFIRERFSKNGMPLKQVLLLFKKTRNGKKFFIKSNSICKSPKDLLLKNYEIFKKALPYKNPPYNSRNWGHALHNLCSYQGKLKPSLAHFLVKLFSLENMKILDPLCGVGTIPLEACLQGRIGIGNDLSLLAYVNTLAKVNKPNQKKMSDEISKLEKFIRKNLVSKSEVERLKFGYNRNITEYYHPDTLREIITARNYFKRIKSYDCEKALLLSATLHILHGNRPYALSRRSHNVTPLAPKGPFVYKSLIEKVNEKIKRTLELERPQNFRNGEAFNEDYKNLDARIKDNSIDLIITSPPFFDSTRFYMSNWIRMWFCGWDKDDFETKKNEYLETQQVKNMSVYGQFFKICKRLLKKDGIIIMHLGKSDKQDMGKTLSEIASEDFEVFDLFDENVSHCEKFGIKDQGATRAHQFLFLIK